MIEWRFSRYPTPRNRTCLHRFSGLSPLFIVISPLFRRQLCAFVRETKSIQSSFAPLTDLAFTLTNQARTRGFFGNTLLLANVIKLPNMQATSLPTKARCLATAAALSLLLNSALAQAVAPNASDSTKPKVENEETVELSPFVVDASKDQGYRATSTLAGSRINTSLKDVAQSITVVTKEFLNDVSAVNINDVLAYTANTEGSRDFTSAPLSLGAPTDGVASNSNRANRIRGLAAADLTRDYFYTIGDYNGFDSYNLDEVTVVRGPNSILAGLGSPAGIINFSPQMAGLSQNKNELSYRFGSFGDQRAILNSNYVALKDVFAVRVAGEWSDKGFKQTPSYNKDQRLYFTGTYQPWRKTTIRASYETQKVTANNPNSITPADGVSQWVAAGKPIYDSSSGLPAASILTQNFGNTPTVMYNAAGAIERVYNLNYNTPHSAGYNFFQSTKPGATAYRMNDDRYFKLEDVNLNPSLDKPRKYKAFNFSVDQEIVRNLNANISYVHEVVDAEYLNLFRSGYATYSIDVNARLPDGTPNPHVGETYMEFGGLDNKNTDHNTNSIWRGTLTYDLNLTKYNKWFGRYTLTGFAEKRKTESEHWQYNAKQVGDSSVENIDYRYYMGGTAANNYMAQTVPKNPGLVTGAGPNIYFDTASNSFKTNTLDAFYALKSDSKFLRDLTTEAFVAQAYLWEDRIVPMFGIRHDKDETSNASSAGGSGGVANPAGPYGTVTKFTKSTKTYGAVFHALKWLSFHYNHSENFIPNAGAVDLLLNPTPSPTGLTKEYGLSVNLLDNKLNAKLNWFELTAAGAGADNLTSPLAQWTVPYMELTFMPDLVRQANLAGANITYKPLIAPGLITGDPRLVNAYTSSNVSKGLELELTYNVTKNWRIMGSVSKQDAKQSNIAAPLTAFIENRLAYWKSIPAIWTGPYVGQNVGWGVGRTGEQQWNNDNNPFYLLYKSVDGQPSQQLAKWHASGLTNYTFNDGALKGFSVGGGLRYIQKSIIGNPQILDASGTPVALDLAHPYYNGDRLAVDMWVGYKMKIFANKYDLSFQLNARDLDQGGSFRPIAANPDGTHSTYQIVQPRTFYLTTTLEF
jgi:outer membrane receptor protein involved in Fe transport